VVWRRSPSAVGFNPVISALRGTMPCLEKNPFEHADVGSGLSKHLGRLYNRGDQNKIESRRSGATQIARR
jgi:hypothetical protein